jgi:hypothetical protein
MFQDMRMIDDIYGRPGEREPEPGITFPNLWRRRREIEVDPRRVVDHAATNVDELHERTA